MAGKRKAEGIALLSVYGGDDDDDVASQASAENDDETSPERREEDTSPRSVPRAENEFLHSTGVIGPSASAAVAGRVSSPRGGGLGIVDYAHDEGVALSPEAEDGEIIVSGRGTGDDSEPQPENGFIRESPSGTQTSTPGNLPTPQRDNTVEGSTIQSSETANVQEKPSGEGERVQVPDAEPMELDILNDFLPPVPTTKYSGELQTKFAKYLALKKTGKSLNEQLRNTKGYRNPDFLQSAVRHYDIDHIGSCFKKEVFNPHGYEPSDYYDAIALEIRREAERKEQERRQTQRVDFVRSNIQPSVAVPKSLGPVVHKVVTVASSDTSGKADGRSSKKSKWDKVELEGARTSQTISTTADAIAAASAHAALLTATVNAGAGYASFAQQRRREAEEKQKVTEKNPLPSSSRLERKTDRS